MTLANPKPAGEQVERESPTVRQEMLFAHRATREKAVGKRGGFFYRD
jgi:hypothetical protein